jgi:hypothetical protein
VKLFTAARHSLCAYQFTNSAVPSLVAPSCAIAPSCVIIQARALSGCGP